ncbi:MAG: response regulator transcription factor [Oscillospiraceae bacterium]
MFTILVVEDDKNTRKLMCAVLKRSGFEVYSAENGVEALDVMDIMMPEMDGYELTRELREADVNLPILMVSAKEEARDRRKGFRVGTDDYMVKPVDEEEMVLRIHALLRRAQIAHDKRLYVGDTVLDYDAMTVTQGEERVTLPQKKFLLLFKLLSYPGVIFTRIQLMDEIWGMDSNTDDHTVNVHINRLRDKVKGNQDFEIVTVRGVGYKAEKLS